MYLKIFALVITVIISILLWRGVFLSEETYEIIINCNNLLGVEEEYTFLGEDKRDYYKKFYNKVLEIGDDFIESANGNPISNDVMKGHLESVNSVTQVYTKTDNNQLNKIVDYLKEVGFSQASGSIKLSTKFSKSSEIIVMNYYNLIYDMRFQFSFMFYGFLTIMTILPIALAADIFFSIKDKDLLKGDKEEDEP